MTTTYTAVVRARVAGRIVATIEFSVQHNERRFVELMIEHSHNNPMAVEAYAFLTKFYGHLNPIVTKEVSYDAA